MGKNMKQKLTLGLVSCTKSKKNYRCRACEMYSPSSLFRKAYTYATEKYDLVAILSAKYGLLLPDDEIEPYDQTLNKMNRRTRIEWADKVYDQMKNRLNMTNVGSAYFHTGERYREYLIPRLETAGIKCIVPLEGLTFGQQLAWYNDRLSNGTFEIAEP